MDFMAQTLPTVEENLALDEALLLDAEAGTGSEVLRIWEWASPAVVLGSGCSLAADVDEARCLADNVPVTRRSSGGGTVLLDSGCLCFSLVLSYGRAPALGDIRASYRYILARVQMALNGLLPNIELAGISDLASRSRKFSGNAQQRKRAFLLHHGTLMFGMDLTKVGRYLKQPARQPEYRQQRAHTTFLVNLPTNVAELTRRLRDAWKANASRADIPDASVRTLVSTKYACSQWVRRR